MPSFLTPDQNKKYSSRLLGQKFWPVLPHRWQQNRAISKLLQDGSSAATRAMALAVVSQSLDDEVIRQNLITALKSMREAQQLQEIAEIAIQFSSEKRSEQLFSLIKEADYLPLEPPDRRVAVALACGWPERLANDGPEIVPPLLKACDTSSGGQEAAISAIRSLRAPVVIDALCHRWMETGTAGDDLATLLLSTGHSPSKPAERALFWLLIGQFQRYEELDLDGSLLVQAQAVASANIRKRLAAAAAAAGRTEWLGAMQQSKPIDQFDANNWSTTVQLLERAGDPQSIWQWALKASPMHAQVLLKALLSVSPQSLGIPEVAVELQSLANQLPEVPDRHHLLPKLCTHTLFGHSAEILSISWSPDGRCLASGSADRTIRLWDPLSDTCAHTLIGHSESVRLIAWSPDGRCLASGGGYQTIRLWDPASGACTQSLSCKSSGTVRVISSEVESIAWSPDGRWLATDRDRGNNRIELWDLASGSCTHTISHCDDSMFFNYPSAWSPDGHWLAFGGMDNEIRLWDPASGACTHTLSGHSAKILSLSWSPDGRWLASGSADKTIRLWDPFSGTCTHTLIGHPTKCKPIAWSPDGRWLASINIDGGCCGYLKLWDPASGACIHTFPSRMDSGCSIALSPDGRHLATTSSNDSTIRLWDPTTGACTHTLSGHSAKISTIAWSPDGRCLASGGHDKTIRLWTNGFSSLFTMPLACYDEKQWKLLSTLQQESPELEDWQRPWLEFIAALGAVIRRFDVNVDDVATQPGASAFEVEIDG